MIASNNQAMLPDFTRTLLVRDLGMRFSISVQNSSMELELRVLTLSQRRKSIFQHCKIRRYTSAGATKYLHDFKSYANPAFVFLEITGTRDSEPVNE